MNDNLDDFFVDAVFPVPIISFKYKKDDKLENFLKTQKISERFKSSGFNNNTQEFGTVSENVSILRTKECAELRKCILEKSLFVAQNILGFDVNEMVDVLSWVSVKSPTQQHTLHAHPNSIISGVYYFDSNVTPITFVDPKIGTSSSTYTFNVPKKDKSKDAGAENNLFSGETIQIGPNHGTIIMFPSYLRHMVRNNETQEKRYSLAFNLVPKFNVGLVTELTYFNFKDAI